MDPKTKAIFDSLFNSTRSLAEATSDLLLKRPDLLPDYLEVAFSDISPYNMRATNMIEKADEKQAGYAASLAPQIIDRLDGFVHPGQRRCFLRMLIRYVHILDEEETGKLYDICYAYAINFAQPIAVRHNSIRVLDAIGKKYPEIADDINLALKLRLDEEQEPFKNWLKKYLGV